MRAQQLLVGVGPIFSISLNLSPRLRVRRQGWVPVVAAAAAEQNHYAVLGLNLSASSADIKTSYRLLARKYHPDVCKDSQASEVFKTIRLAYDVLSNEVTRARYDRALKFGEDTGFISNSRQQQHKRPRNEEKYEELKRRMRQRKQQYWDDNGSKKTDQRNDAIRERGPFGEVLRSALVCLVLLRILGSRFSIGFSSVVALADWELDNGYKMGYLIAWVLGGRGGVVLALCLSFASWACGKTSSGIVALVVVATWVASSLARFVPMPRGAILTLVYMSIRLQADLS